MLPGSSVAPSGPAIVQIDGLGALTFDSGAVTTVRPDVFRDGHYALFDVLVHLHRTGQIGLAYHLDETLGTHVIEAINGLSGWWYDAYYSGDWSEKSTMRMDLYPYKRGTVLRIRRADPERIRQIETTFRDEMQRLAESDGRVIVPSVKISTPRGRWAFSDVTVCAHDTRGDVLVPGTVTALDILLSLCDQGLLSDVSLVWYDRIGAAETVASYFVEQVNEAVAYGGCGFVYEVGPEIYAGYRGNHVHVPSDVRVIVAPAYGRWYWLCLRGPDAYIRKRSGTDGHCP